MSVFIRFHRSETLFHNTMTDDTFCLRFKGSTCVSFGFVCLQRLATCVLKTTADRDDSQLDIV